MTTARVTIALAAALGTFGYWARPGNSLIRKAAAAGAVVPATATATATAARGTQGMDWTRVAQAIGRPGVAQSGEVYRVNFPRGDMRVTAGGVAIKPPLALGGWVAFKAAGAGGGAMAMGDLVLAEDEVAPVISALQRGGVEQTAIHHHLVRESPRVLYMHIHAFGDPLKIAATIRDAVALTKTPPPPPPPPAAPAPAAPAPLAPPTPTAAGFGIDTAQVAKTLGVAGRVNGGVYQVSVPRAETVRDGGMEIPASMGLGTAINFQPTGGGKAAIAGDFVLIAGEVNPVIRALREHGIEVTSIHNHLLAEEPRLFFMHFWANDDAVLLARGLRAALDRTNSRIR